MPNKALHWTGIPLRSIPPVSLVVNEIKINKHISIITNCQALQPYLNSDIPDGVKITSPPPREKRGLDFNITVNLDIQLVIDLTKITATALAAWIVKKSLAMKGNHRVNINGKQISVDGPKAIDLITNEIEEKKNDQNI
ncbi:MAG: hypothetical protein ABIK92_18085 [Pseudomonadota bacterium]